jgi:hypothetical protein
MRYVIEKNDGQAWDAIMKDLAVNNGVYQHVDRLRSLGEDVLPPGRVKDMDGHSYLFSLPALIRAQIIESDYVFVYEGAPCKITVKMPPLACQVKLHSAFDGNAEDWRQFKAALTSAFHVHQGFILERGGQLVAVGEEVVPVFDDEAAG